MPGVYLNPLDYPDDWNTVVFAGNLRTPGKCKVGKWERKAEYDHKKGKGTKGASQTLKDLPPAAGEIEFWAWTPAHFAAWTPILALLHFDPSKGVSTTTPAASTTTASSTPSAVPTGGLVNLPAIPGNTTSGLSTFTGNTSTSSSSTATTQPALSSAYAIDVFHPAIADLDVHYILPPESLGSWEEDGEASGMYKRTIKFTEFTGTPPNASVAATPTGAAASNTVTPAATQQPAGTQEGGAPGNAAAGANSAAADAQGAWGAP